MPNDSKLRQLHDAAQERKRNPWCECEHESHFAQSYAHEYGHGVATHKVTTAHGTYRICQVCVDSHHLHGFGPITPLTEDTNA